MIDARELQELQQEHARIGRVLDQAIAGSNHATALLVSLHERCEHLVEAQSSLTERIEAALEDRR